MSYDLFFVFIFTNGIICLTVIAQMSSVTSIDTPNLY